MAQKKRWSELSQRARTAIVIGGIAEAVVTTVAFRDLASRRRGKSGSKVLWVLGFFVQPIGPLLYLRAGRRRITVSEP